MCWWGFFGRLAGEVLWVEKFEDDEEKDGGREGEKCGSFCRTLESNGDRCV